MNNLNLIEKIDEKYIFLEDVSPNFIEGDVFIAKQNWEDMKGEIKIQEEKDKILDPVFIHSEEAHKIKITQKNREILELKKSIANQKDLITNIPEILAKIIRKEDIKGENKLLQDIFQEFCDAMDKHGVSYNKRKLISKIYRAKNRLKKLESKLDVSVELDDGN